MRVGDLVRVTGTTWFYDAPGAGSKFLTEADESGVVIDVVLEYAGWHWDWVRVLARGRSGWVPASRLEVILSKFDSPCENREDEIDTYWTSLEARDGG